MQSRNMLLPTTEHPKILVVGTSCSGKTTLASQIAKAMSIPHFDLDEFHWLPGWKERAPEEFQGLVHQRVLPLDSWVVSGNYTSRARESIWPSATTIVWLNYPLPLILGRYYKRTFRRVVFKEPCCNGNYETVRHAVFSHDNLFFWILKTYWSRPPRYRRWMRDDTFGSEWIVLRNKRTTRELLEKLSRPTVKKQHPM